MQDQTIGRTLRSKVNPELSNLSKHQINAGSYAIESDDQEEIY